MNCETCDDIGWVCESHPDRPWEGPCACLCGAAGAPCNFPTDGEPPRMPAGFGTGVNKERPRCRGLILLARGCRQGLWAAALHVKGPIGRN
jgi:hypothetical protein